MNDLELPIYEVWSNITAFKTVSSEIVYYFHSFNQAIDLCAIWRSSFSEGKLKQSFGVACPIKPRFLLER